MPVTIPTIAPPLDPPSRGSPGPIFRPTADAFMERWPVQINQVRSAVAGMNAAGVLIEQQATAVQANADQVAAAVTSAQAAAAAALGAPGTYATSVTSQAIASVASAGAISGVMTAGKLYIPGLTLLQAPPAPNAANQIVFRLDTYNTGTGAYTGTVISTQGAGTFGSWNIGLTASVLLPIATKEDLWAGTDNGKVVTATALAAADEFQTLTDAPTVSWNTATQGWNAKVTLNATRALAVPSNLKLGRVYTLLVVRGASGGGFSTLPSEFDVGVAGQPSWSTVAGKVDRLRFQCVSLAPAILDTTFKKAG